MGLTKGIICQDFLKDYSNHESYFNKYDDETFVFLRIMQVLCLYLILSSYCNLQFIFNQILFSGNFFILGKYLGFPLFSKEFNVFLVLGFKYLKYINVSRVSCTMYYVSSITYLFSLTLHYASSSPSYLFFNSTAYQGSLI